MNFLKKTIFLSNNEKNKGMAILTLESKSANMFGTIKTYSNDLNGNYILGIKCNERVIKQNVNLDNNTYSFILSDRINLTDSLGCVLLKAENNTIEPVLWGSEKSENYKGKIINTLRESISRLSSTATAKTTLSSTIKPSPLSTPSKATKTYKSDCLLDCYASTNNQRDSSAIVQGEKDANSTQSKSASECYRRFENSGLQVDDIIKETLPAFNLEENKTSSNADTLPQNACENESVYSPIKHQIEIQNHTACMPEQYTQISLDEEVLTQQNMDEIAISQSVAQLFETDENEVNDLIDNELNKIESGKHNFYDMISDQLKELFDRYPREENLSKLIDNSNWVKIDTDTQGKYHVVGVIMHNDDIKYICYGVPGTYTNEPPMEMRDYSQWLPTDINDPYNMGYWVMYQDADTGENVMVS